MGAVVHDIELDRGGRYVFAVEVLDSDGTAADLTSYSGQVEIWSSHEDDATLLATGSVSIDADDGIVTVTIPGSATENATWKGGVYDVLITNGSAPEYVARGTTRLRPTVTRP